MQGQHSNKFYLDLVRLWKWNYSSFFLFCWSTENYSHLVITPQSPVLEIGTNFTATCMIINTNEVTADDLYWKLFNFTISKKHYTKVNKSALSVTIPVTGEESGWLKCHCKKDSNYVTLNRGKFVHGITLTKGCKFLLSECVKTVATILMDPLFFFFIKNHLIHDFQTIACSELWLLLSIAPFGRNIEIEE